MKTRPTLSLLSLALFAPLAACDEPEPAALACTQPQALVSGQGVGLNGVELNSLTANGTQFNSLTANGTKYNALTDNGVKYNALNGNGVAPNAVTFNGVRLNQLSSNGILVNGIRPNQLSVNGLDANGVHYNSLTANGGWSNAISLQGTDLHAVLDGRAIEGEGWVGLTLAGALSDGGTIPLTVAAVTRDPADPELTYFSLETAARENLCGPGGRGLFVAGQWDQTGAHRDSPDLVTYSCTAGVIAKCVAWGYKPWKVGADMHQTCTRMARADYCGDGTPHTENGTPIDVFDGEGIQTPASVPGDGFAFEAAWGPQGAVCVSHPRYLDVTSSGEVRLPSCWHDRPVCRDFTEAQSHAPLIANASLERRRLVCGN